MQGIHGCGIGLRSEFLHDIEPSGFKPDWFEITPENWIYTPHRHLAAFERIVADFPIVTHGVSLSIGSPEPLDMEFLQQLKTFLDRYGIKHYSEHLSFSSLEGRQTYELLPLPMTPKMVAHISQKVNQVQEILQRPLILENASYYYCPYSEMNEADFINAVLKSSGAKLLLDVNNVYVNATNHGFDAPEFIRSLTLDHVAYMHIAGHLEYPEEKLLLDTHGESITKEVWKLLKKTLKLVDAPVMIERDNNIPPLPELMQEYAQLTRIAKG